MIRLLIIGGLLYFGYRKLQSLTQSGGSEDRGGGSEQAVDDVMLKDPYCGVYFPRRDAVPLNVDGKTLLFCSTKCRDQYISENNKA